MRGSRSALGVVLPVWSIVCCTLWVCACAKAPPDYTAEAKKGISATNDKWMKAVEAKNAAGVAALYTDDARVLPPNIPPIEGRAAIEQFFAGMVMGVSRVQLESVEIEGHAETAHEVGKYTMFDANGTQVDDGKEIVIWKKVGDEWKLHRDMFSSNRPPPAPAAPPEAAAPSE
jgi:uncharacterized protein (TIGR02246 family)